jgi:hypothetical protein
VGSDKGASELGETYQTTSWLPAALTLDGRPGAVSGHGDRSMPCASSHSSGGEPVVTLVFTTQAPLGPDGADGVRTCGILITIREG